VSALARAAGAKLLARLPHAAVGKRRSNAAAEQPQQQQAGLVIVVDPDALAATGGAAAGAAAAASAAALGAPIVGLTWLMDCASSLTRRGLEGYAYTPA
jgi:hypothetical protein